MKTCTACKKELPLDAFNVGRGRLGREAKCKECRNARWREYRSTAKGREATRRHNSTSAKKAVRAKYARTEKRKKSSRKYEKTTKGQINVRKYTLKRKYQMTLQQYQCMFSAQGGACAICGERGTGTNGPGRHPLCVDHDHSTNKIRGLLCGRCNRMIGLAKDRIEILFSAMGYIQTHKRRAAG